MELKEIAGLRAKWQATISELSKEKEQIENKIIGLQTMIKGLDYMEHGISPARTQLDPLPSKLAEIQSLGLTAAVRTVIFTAGRPLTPTEVRDQLIAYGFDKLPPGNPMAAIHGVLRRLQDTTGEVKAVTVDGKKVYRRLTENEKAEIMQRNAINLGPPRAPRFMP
jgi:hypothetical protein